MKLNDIKPNWFDGSLADWLRIEEKTIEDMKLSTNGYDLIGLRLTSLKGCPDPLNGDLLLDSNLLSSFDTFPKHVHGYIYIGGNEFTSLQGIEQIKTIQGRLSLGNMRIKSHLMGVFKIKGFAGFTAKHPESALNDAIHIMNSFLPCVDRRWIYDCQEELINNNLDDFAKL